MFDVKKLRETIKNIIGIEHCKTLEEANTQEKYSALSKVIMGTIIKNFDETKKAYSKDKQAYYLSAEFLMGRALGNNLMNLGIYEEVRDILKEMNIDINEVEEIEEDAGLGNGGLGRLAACFMDSCGTLNLPVTGYGIRYSHGLFKQSFEDGFQREEGDNWLKYGDPWSIRRDEDTVIVEFADEKVKAVPYDTPIIGYDTKNINTLRLWKAESLNDQRSYEATCENNKVDEISRVLYPDDSTQEGKILRLKQQYFFVSASLKDIIREYKKNHGGDFKRFPEFHAIQLNDTHPVVAIPELMRLLVDEENISWEIAWDITVKTFSYTNHTILAEALEQWWNGLYKKILPSVYEIIEDIDKRFVMELLEKGYDSEKINSMSIIYDDMIRMAFLAIHGTHTVNGVAQIHTDILKFQELKDWHELYPNRFQNKTNGITQRRWLALCNKELSQMITELLGTNYWIRDLSLLKGLEKFLDNKEVLNRFLSIKQDKKEQLAQYVKVHEGTYINPNSIFDIQIKRLHEYKRQLLNAFGILDLYYRLKENPEMDIVPRTFIFGAKAAPGYFRAKGIIKFINEIAKLINNDLQVNEKVKVVFVQNYRVSYAEKLFPAADISEQISTAGKEASGTGNMKFMLNGTPTLGTYDGANVEIVEEAGEENNFIFGARVEEIERIKDTYKPKEYYEKSLRLKRVVDSLIDGTFSDGDTGMFKELYNSLLEGTSWHKSDHYFIFRDFHDYIEAQNKVDKAYRDRIGFARMCLKNMSNAGKFSSDRTIEEYAREIWHIEPKKI